MANITLNHITYSYAKQNKNGTNTITITGITNSYTKDLIIPNKILGKPVTEIANFAFMENHNLISITLPETIQTIGRGAFFDCTQLKGIHIPQNIKCIEANAFGHCVKLEDFTLPDDHAIKIGEDILEKTKYYENPKNWHDKLLYVGNHLITAQNDITGSIQIKNGTKSIAQDAFIRCKNVESIYVADSVEYIGDYAFSCCYALKEIKLPEKLKEINASLFEMDCNLSFVIIPSQVREIKNNAFSYSGISNITIPKKVSKINEFAFSNCKDLTSVKIKSTTPKFSRYVFYECENLKKITIFSNQAKFEDNTLENINDHFKVFCQKDSQTLAYLKKINIPTEEFEFKLESFLKDNSSKTI